MKPAAALTARGTRLNSQIGFVSDRFAGTLARYVCDAA